MEKAHRSFKAGVLYILAAWLLFTLMTIFARFASRTIPLVSILFLQNLIGLVTLIPWIKKHGWDLMRTKRFGLLLFRSLASISAIGLSFLAVQKTSLVDTMLLNNASPLWIPFVVFFWLRNPINHSLWPGLCAGFIGIVMILNPGKEFLQAGALFALAAGILQSINMVSIRVLSHTERNHTVMFYYFLICTIVTLPFAAYEWVQPNFIEWSEIIAIGLCLALGQWAFVRAFHHAKASDLGPFCYSAVVYSVLIDWALYQQMPTLLAWIGIALVCAGGIWAIRFSSSS
ncbi:MAG: DMT family transporter [Parachlamydiales bacterium]|nr:DMT family transporter [Parachlamydiales bacterium]